MQQPDSRIQRDNKRDVIEPAGENIAGENLFEMFGSLWRSIDQEDGCRGGYDVDDADQRFLRRVPQLRVKASSTAARNVNDSE
jgi:hypothetical protein